MTSALVILAGGAGRRLGFPKAAAGLLGQPFAQVQVQTGRRAGCEPVILVLGCEAESILRDHPGLERSARVVVCSDWQLGQFASLEAGLDSLLEECRTAIPHVFVLPVDALPIKTQTFATLAQALDSDLQLDAALPVHEGRGGHPVLLASRFWPELLERDPAQSRLDHILIEARVRRVSVDDPGVLVNINTPQDLHRIKELLGSSRHVDQ